MIGRTEERAPDGRMSPAGRHNLSSPRAVIVAALTAALLLARPATPVLLIVAVPLLLLALRAGFRPKELARWGLMAFALLGLAQWGRSARLAAATLPDRQDAPLRRSGPVVITAHDQIVENLDIVGVPGQPAIRGAEKRGVAIRNCRIRHPVGCHGIDLRSCPGAVIENCDFVVSDAPAVGPLARETNAIQIFHAADTVVRRIRVRDCSAGVYALHGTRLRLQNIEGHNLRGPVPRGNLVQFDKCEDVLLEDFSAESDVTTANTEDVISFFFTKRGTLRRGLIDGNNSTVGCCVMFQDSEDGICEDVDAIRFSNCAFSAYPGKRILFRRCRARDSYRPTLRGEPSSKSIVFSSGPGSQDIRVVESRYFAHVNPRNVAWDERRFAELDLRYAEFSPRAPLRLTGLPG